jgi:hypothetical protein
MIGDPPVPGAMRFLSDARKRFEVHILSSRTHQEGGLDAMKEYIKFCLNEELPGWEAEEVFDALRWPTEKPPALVTIDDRAVCFTGTFPDLDELAAFKPWNRRGDQ